jgi:hypothetical protein
MDRSPFIILEIPRVTHYSDGSEDSDTEDSDTDDVASFPDDPPRPNDGDDSASSSAILTSRCIPKSVSNTRSRGDKKSDSIAMVPTGLPMAFADVPPTKRAKRAKIAGNASAYTESPASTFKSQTRASSLPGKSLRPTKKSTLTTKISKDQSKAAARRNKLKNKVGPSSKERENSDTIKLLS